MLVREGVHVDEDRLTHAVLGLMRYLPADLWFPSFIKVLRSKNGAALETLDQPGTLEKVCLWESYPVPSEWQKLFGPVLRETGEPRSLKGTICPDALIKTSNWAMLVESEYSHELEAEQLFQQFAIATRMWGEAFFLLLINNRWARPAFCGVDSAKTGKPQAGVRARDSLETYIAACCQHALGLPFTEQKVRERLLWINWQSLWEFLSGLQWQDNADFVGLPTPYQLMVKTMRDDVCGLLEREGLVPIPPIVQSLGGLSVTLAWIPSRPSLAPITQSLNRLVVDPHAIPQWNYAPDIAKQLGSFRIDLSCMPLPLDKQV